MMTARSALGSWRSQGLRALGCCLLLACGNAGGAELREAWRDSRLTGTPDPPHPFRVERRFPNLEFRQPVEMVREKHEDRWWVVEVNGAIRTFPDDPEAAGLNLAIDLKELPTPATRAYGLALHPDFRRNRKIYLCYITGNKLADGTRVSEFRVSGGEAPVVDPESERTIVTWRSGGHNGGSLQFGPDGFLYISTGDAEVPSPPDPLKTGQDVSDLLASILRIDVDQRDPGREYRIPPDNPFVDLPGARPEIWAYGFRNPWRMSFDPGSGRLWVGDVGWELWELVYDVRKGGNYGWSIMEGPQPVDPGGRRGPTPILEPTAVHNHIEGRSVTGGYVYRGSGIPELQGQYIYGDYVTGRIWALPVEGGSATPREIALTPLQIICFGYSSDGELYVVDYAGGIYGLVPNPGKHAAADFPERLSETGLFASTVEHRLAPGVIPYSINAEGWMDGATAERFVALPGTPSLETYKRNNPGQGEVRDAWRFPTNAVVGKTVFLETDPGNAASRRRVETQILHRHGNEWLGYNYVWNEAQSDAVLDDRNGSETVFQIKDAAAPGGQRRQTWRHSSRAECLICHTARAGVLHAFNVEQLSRGHDYGKGVVDQMDALQTMDLIGELPKRAGPPMIDPREQSVSVERRARVYLHVNCSHCHRKGGGGTATLDVRYEVALEKTGMIDAVPTQGAFGIEDARIVAPGRPWRSVLYYRMAKLGKGHMPHIGSRVVDVEGLKLVHQWISELGGDTSASQPARSQPAESLSIDTPAAALRVVARIDAGDLAPVPVDKVVARGTAHPNPAIRDLFERFVPEELRVERLGPNVQPQVVLALEGDATRGESIFFREGGAQCFTCHKVRGRGREVGPDLSAIGAKYPHASQLLDQILNPSNTIDPAWVSYEIETRDESSYTGLIVREGAGALVLRDAAGMDHEIPAREVLRKTPLKLSSMPAGLLQGMTPREAADLLAFLASLK